MKLIKISVGLCVLLCASLSNSAWAHGRVRVGVYVGAPLFAPWYYPPPIYYAPNYYSPYNPYYPNYSQPTTVITVPAPAQTIYIEQGTTAPAQKSVEGWNYCNNPDGYYPYVKECPGGWKKMTP